MIFSKARFFVLLLHFPCPERYAETASVSIFYVNFSHAVSNAVKKDQFMDFLETFFALCFKKLDVVASIKNSMECQSL